MAALAAVEMGTQIQQAELECLGKDSLVVLAQILAQAAVAQGL
jgi:hypothetical protein